VIEVTDEMVQAYFKAATEQARKLARSRRSVESEGSCNRAGLAAALAIVERDRKAQIAEAAATKRPTQEMLDAYAEVAPSGQVSVWGVMAVLAVADLQSTDSTSKRRGGAHGTDR
jgi:hypothetical protein